MEKIGYIRVSTEHQETARQEALMKQYQVERVFAGVHPKSCVNLQSSV